MCSQAFTIETKFLPGNIHEEEVWADEESLWVECPLWMRDSSYYLQLQQQAPSGIEFAKNNY